MEDWINDEELCSFLGCYFGDIYISKLTRFRYFKRYTEHGVRCVDVYINDGICKSFGFGFDSMSTSEYYDFIENVEKLCPELKKES